jgi:hypothetical protein
LEEYERTTNAVNPRRRVFKTKHEKLKNTQGRVIISLRSGPKMLLE